MTRRRKMLVGEIIPVLDLFSAAAGGWSLGMHRAGFATVAACESVAWRRALYAQNNPGVPIYDDVRTLTADRLVRDLGFLPDIIVGSPPCQDISSANTKGKGVEGERSGLFFEAVRIIGECRPRWFALENSANLRTRGADAVLAALEALGYACWPFVVRAGDIGANHERPRSWLIGCDVGQVADAHGLGRHEEWSRRRLGVDVSISPDIGGPPPAPHQARLSVGQVEPSLREASQPIARCDDGQSGEVAGRSERLCSPERREMGICEADRVAAVRCRSDWSLDDLADHIRLDDGLSAWVADTRIAVGGPRGTSAASLIVEAFGDAVVPQIPEAIGRAILRVEAAMAAVSAASSDEARAA